MDADPMDSDAMHSDPMDSDHMDSDHMRSDPMDCLAYQNVETEHQKERSKETQSDPKRPKRSQYPKKYTPN